MIKRIGKYEVQAEIGVGGFGTVYRAFDPIVGRTVAIKVMKPTEDKSLLVRFRNEALSAGSLRHPNIVTVYDFGEDEGTAYLVMELLEGEDLQSVLKSKRELTLLEKVRLMTQVADGLNAAHSRGIVHRDIKPGNIMLLSDGSAKIMDFGIARLTAPDRVQLTQQGYLLGTIYYMSPEQLTKGQTDNLSDIFAWGTIYYELISGTHPFDGDTRYAVMYNIVNKEPALIRSIVPSCPENLARIIHHALQTDRDMRYQSTEDILLDSQPLLIELQQRTATSLLVEAQRMYGEDNLDAALARTRQVLELDPANAGGRKLRESIQREIKQRTIRPRIESLTRSGTQHLEAHRFKEALADFEGALRLDRDDANLQALVGRARELRDRSVRAARLIDEARSALDQKDLTAAYQNAAEALREEADNPNALKLMEDVRAAMEQRERERRLREGMSRVQALILLRSWDDAISLLTELEAAYPDDASILATLDQAKTERAGEERQRRLTTGIANIRSLLSQRSLEDAVARGETLARDFPDVREVTALLDTARRELREQQRLNAVSALRERAARLSAERQYDQALRTIADVQAAYPEATELEALVRETRAAKEQWERDEAIAEAVRSTAGLTAQSRFEEAVRVIEQALVRFPGQAALESARRAAIDAWERRKRADAIEKAAHEARESIAERQFDRAIASLEAAIAEHDAGRELAQLLNEARDRLLERRRAEAIRTARAEAGVYLGHRDFGAADAALRRVLESWPDDPEILVSLHEVTQARSEFEAAVADAVRRVSDLRSARRFAEAIATADSALLTLGDDPRLAGQKRITETEAERCRREEHVRRAAEDGLRLANAGRLEESIAALEKASAEYPNEPALASALKAAGEKLRERRLAEAIAEACREAGELSGRHEFEAALSLLQSRMETLGRQEKLLQALRETQAAQQQWERQQAIAGTQSQAGSQESAGDFARAMETVEAALRRYPSDPSLLSLRQRISQAWEQRKRADAIERAEGDARQAIAQQDLDRAVSGLERAIRQYSAAVELNGLLGEAREALAARRRAEAIQKIRAEAETLAADGDYKAAARTVQKAQRSWPGEPSLLAAAERIDQARRQAEHRQAVSEAITRSQRLRGRGREQEAVKTLDEAIGKLGEDPALRQERSNAAAEFERKCRAEASQRALEQSRKLIAGSHLDEAVALLQQAAHDDPEHAGLASALAAAEESLCARRRAEAIETACREAAALRDQGRFDAASALIETQLRDDPANETLLAARDSTQAAKQRFEQEEARRRASAFAGEGRFGEALEVLDAALQSFPGNAVLERHRWEIRDAWFRRERADAITNASLAARSLLDEGRFAEAASVLQAAVDRHNAEADLQTLLHEAREGIAEQERLRAVDRAAAEARRLIEQDDFPAAMRALEEPLASWPGEPALLAAMAEAREGLARREREKAITTTLTLIQDLRQTGRFGEAAAALADAARAHGAHPLLEQARRELDTEVRRRSEELRQVHDDVRRAIAEGRPQEGVAVVQRALEQKPGNAELSALLSFAEEAVRTQQRLEEIDGLRRTARSLAGAGDFDQAIAALESGVARFPGEKTLQRLLNQAREQADAARKAAGDVAAEAQRLAGRDLLRDALSAVEAGLRQYPRDRALAELRNHIVARIEQAEKAPPPPPPAETPGDAPAAVPAEHEPAIRSAEPVPPKNRRRWFIAVPVAAAALTSVILLLNRGGTGAVEIRTTPTGAEISIGDRSCVSPHCRFDLPPGKYELRARMTGYRPVAEVLTVPRKPGGPVDIRLEPLPAELSLSTNLEQGRVRLDGRDDELRGGQMSPRELPPGTHRIEIEGEGARAFVVLNTAPGAPPSVSSIESSGGAEVLSVGNAGSQLTVSCRCQADSVSLDGKPFGDIRPREVTANGLAEGSHEIRTSSSGGQNSFVFSARPQPSVQIFFRTEKNVGTLLVETGEDGASVVLNGKPREQTTVRGALSVALPAERYSVTVRKPGFQTPPVRTVTIRKGLTERIAFRLTPVDAILEIADGLPGAQVLVDSKPAGTISDGGRLSTAAPPGWHEVEIAKPGYTSRRTRLNFERGKTTPLRGPQALLALIPAPPEPPKQQQPPVTTAPAHIPEPQVPKPPPPDPRQVEAAEWARLQDSRDVHALEEFRRRYPAGADSEQAARRIEQLEWESVNRMDTGALRAYARKYPSSPYAQQAQTEIARLEQAGRTAAEGQAVLQALTKYEAAFARKDLNDLRAIWPSMPKGLADTYRTTFREVQSITVRMRPTSDPAITGDAATVVCTRSIRQVAGRKSYDNTDRVRVVLTRAGNGWVIQSIDVSR